MTDPRIDKARARLRITRRFTSDIEADLTAISDLLAVIAERDADLDAAAYRAGVLQSRLGQAEAERYEARAAIERAETLAGEWEKLGTYELPSSPVARGFADALRTTLRGEQ